MGATLPVVRRGRGGAHRRRRTSSGPAACRTGPPLIQHTPRLVLLIQRTPRRSKSTRPVRQTLIQHTPRRIKSARPVRQTTTAADQAALNTAYTTITLLIQRTPRQIKSARPVGQTTTAADQAALNAAYTTITLLIQRTPRRIKSARPVRQTTTATEARGNGGSQTRSASGGCNVCQHENIGTRQKQEGQTESCVPFCVFVLLSCPVQVLARMVF